MDKKLLILSLMLLLLFTIFIGALYFETPTRIRAKQERVPSKCLCFVRPIISPVPANGISNASFTCSVSDNDLNIVPGKKVTVETDLGKLDKPSIETSDSGLAQFKLTSVNAGTATLRARVGELSCEPVKGITVIFQ